MSAQPKTLSIEWPLRLPLHFGVAIVLFAVATLAPAQQADLTHVQELYIDGKYRKGTKMLERARDQAERTGESLSFVGWMLLVKGYNAQGEFERAEGAARAAVDRAQSASERLTAHNGLAVAIYAEGRADDLEMEEAVRHFRIALDAAQGRSNTVKLGLARALIHLYQQEEAQELLQQVADHPQAGPLALEARSLIERPERATLALAPTATLDMLEGGRMSLHELAGKVVLLDFWATWCRPCRVAIPALREIKEEFADRGFEILGVSVDEEPRTIKQFVASNEMPWLHAWDAGQNVARRYRVSSYPSYVLLGADGEVLWSQSGWSEQVELGLRFEIDKALSELEVRNR